jgi:HemY protein
MRLVEAAWLAEPHPDLADAYAHVKLGDSARQRLVRVETLAEKAPGHIESALAVARAAIDASEFVRARQVLAPFVANPTQRVAMLMAEIERGEHGDTGRARAWMLRAVRARHDPVWTADGYVSDRWRPVSPVTGRLDAFQWQTPLAALPSDKGVTVEVSPFEEAMLAPPPRELPPEPAAPTAPVAPAASQDNSPDAAAVEANPTPPFSARPAPARNGASAVPPIIPIVRAPDDPGTDEESPGDEFAEPVDKAQAQAGGWRGFLSRFGG